MSHVSVQGSAIADRVVVRQRLAHAEENETWNLGRVTSPILPLTATVGRA
jgi:hypothetical protein